MEDKSESKSNVLMRLRRIEGQIRGLQRMVEAEAPWSEILTQVGAVTAAVKKVGTAIIHTHMEECLEKTLSKGGDRQREILRDFQKAMARYIDWA
jgi:CsoR family transcriptional regulator, copper-sensing transcriptional repressor